MKPALFLDRDGTLIVDVGYPRDPDRVELLPGVVEALRELRRSFELVIVSNQSGIGRGLITEAEARAVHDRVISVFLAAGIDFAGAYYCPHAPGAGCACRKPAPGMLLDAARELDLDLARSVMIGDKPSDIAAGRAAGCGRTIRFGPEDDRSIAGPREARIGESLGRGSPLWGPSGDDDGATARCDDWIAVRRAIE